MSNSRSFGMKKFRFDAEYFFLGIDGMECDSEYFFRFLFIWFWGTGDYFFCKETRTTACKFQSLSRKCAVRVICTWLWQHVQMSVVEGIGSRSINHPSRPGPGLLMHFKKHILHDCAMTFEVIFTFQIPTKSLKPESSTSDTGCMSLTIIFISIWLMRFCLWETVPYLEQLDILQNMLRTIDCKIVAIADSGFFDFTFPTITNWYSVKYAFSISKVLWWWVIFNEQRKYLTFGCLLYPSWNSSKMRFWTSWRCC